MSDRTEIVTRAESNIATMPVEAMPLSLRIWFDDKLFARCETIANKLAKAQGMVPPHLIGKPEACFAVVERSLTWNLSPFAVANATYATPGGRVGFEGKLCQAILENSGHLVGAVKFEHIGTVKVKLATGIERSFRTNDPELAKALAAGGSELRRNDWSAVQGKFEIVDSKKEPRPGEEAKKYARAKWQPDAEEGLSVIVSAQIRGEVAPREFIFDLKQAFPRNSTLWATDPKTQICYTAVRRFANVCAPGIFMGVPFDREADDDGMKEINPRPRRGDFTGDAATTVEIEPFEIVTSDGEVRLFPTALQAGGFFLAQLQDGKQARGRDGVEALWESNGLLITQLRDAGEGKLADELKAAYVELLAPPLTAPSGAAQTAPAKPSPAAQGDSAGATARGDTSAPRPETKPAAPAAANGERAASGTTGTATGAAPGRQTGKSADLLDEKPAPAKSPNSPVTGKGNWPAWLAWFDNQIATLPIGQPLAEFLARHSVEIDAIANENVGEWMRRQEIIDRRNDGRKT